MKIELLLDIYKKINYYDNQDHNSIYAATTQRNHGVKHMVEKNLRAELQYVEDNRDKLISDHRGKYLLIRESDLVGSFDDYQGAAEEGVRLFGPEDNFLVYQALEQPPVNFVMEANL